MNIAVVTDVETGDMVADYTSFGTRVQLRHGGDTTVAAARLRDLRQIWEPFLASRVLPREGTCLDTGAGAGWFALAFARAFPAWRVIALEPDPAQFALLKANAAALGLENVTCLHAGLHPAASLPRGAATALRAHHLAGQPATFRRLLALPDLLAVGDAGVDPAEELMICPALPPAVLTDLAPDLVRLAAPGCEAAVAAALRDVPTGFVAGRIWQALPAAAFDPADPAIPRETYLTDGEHVLRRDYEDHFPGRRPGLDVVVAMYNTREFIAECVDSLLADGNPDIRVLVVDDGSTDGSGDLVRAAYGDNQRVRLLAKDNGGCASARNFGRRHSDASHIAFIDADDRVDPEMFTHLLEVARQTGCFVAEGEFKTFITGEDGMDVFTDSYEVAIYKEPGHHRLGGIDYDWIPGRQIIIGQPTIWRRIHRRDFLDRRKIWFPEHVRAFDDQIFQILVGEYAESIAHVRGHRYHYRQHAGQDIKQGDERHFYSFNMFRAIFLRALDEGWSDLTPVFRSLLNTMRWSYSGLRPDLKMIYLEAAAEFLAVYDRTFGGVLPEQLAATNIPGLDLMFRRRQKTLNDTPVNYAMMRLENWRWQPEFLHMMKAVRT